MPVTGAGARRVLFVGEIPGDESDRSGAPFSGKAGRRLRHLLASLDFDLDQDGWMTNALICQPPRARRPTGAEVGYCRPNMLKAIRELQPVAIVLMGQAAAASVIGHTWKEDIGKIDRWVGWRIPCQTLNTWLCPTWAPTHVDKEDDPVLEAQFKECVKSAVNLDDRPWPEGPPAWAESVQRITDTDKAAQWLRKAAQMTTGAIAYDYETNMLKPDGPDARIVSCAVTWGRDEPERTIAFPWHGTAIEATQELLRSPIPKIASNLKFEDRWSRAAFGHRVRGWAWDTMLAAHVCDNRQAITSVKFQAFVRLGIPLWNDKVEPFLKPSDSTAMNQILREISLTDLLRYNGLDVLLEFRVAIDQMKELGYPRPW